MQFLGIVILSGAEQNRRCKALREQVLTDAKYNPLAVFQLLLNIGQFEFTLKEVSAVIILAHAFTLYIIIQCIIQCTCTCIVNVNIVCIIISL